MLNVSPVGFKKVNNVNPLGFKSVTVQYTDGRGKEKTITGKNAFISPEGKKNEARIEIQKENSSKNKFVNSFKDITVTNLDENSLLSVEGRTVTIKNAEKTGKKSPEVRGYNYAKIYVDYANDVKFFDKASTSGQSTATIIADPKNLIDCTLNNKPISQ